MRESPDGREKLTPCKNLPTTSVQPTPEPTPTPPPIPYTDVPEDAPYYDAVVWAYQHNIATSTTVNPGNLCTSASALTFLWRAEGRPDKLSTLAASGTYYGQPVAWADKNGLFAGTEFDPAAPCSRADLMAYLYLAAEEWTLSEEEQRIQTEYDKILYSYKIHGTGLCYADYVDVDGDGKVELLTAGISGDNVFVTVYANIGGHAGKCCEEVFPRGSTGWLSLCAYDNDIYLRRRIPFSTPDNVFTKSKTVLS